MRSTTLSWTIGWLFLLLLSTLLLTAAGCRDREVEPQVGEEGGPAGEDAVEVLEAEAAVVDPPAGPGALAPRLSPAAGGGLWASWLEPVSGAGQAKGDEGQAPYRLRTSRFDGSAWSDAATVAEGSPEHPFFANWADTPSVVEGSGGELLAHWLAKTGDDTYAYGIFLARSTDGGTTWSELGTLHDDDTPTEHGFVSLLPDPGGGFRAFWLDGRAMAGGGPMAVRTARVDEGVVAASEVLDDRVCECCQTSAALSSAGPLVVYRDRSPQEVRDVHAVLTTSEEASNDGWSEPRAVHADGWTIPGCPVNGPAVDARGERVVVAWFTAADGNPRVSAAFSPDGGATFGDPVPVDGAANPAGGPDGLSGTEGETSADSPTRGPAGAPEAGAPGPPPLGRVDVTWLPDGTAVVSWLAGDGTVRLRRLGSDGTAGPAVRVASTSTARASGFPRIEPVGDGSRLAVAWVDPEAEGGSRVRVATLPVAGMPRGAQAEAGGRALPVPAAPGTDGSPARPGGTASPAATPAPGDVRAAEPQPSPEPRPSPEPEP